MSRQPKEKNAIPLRWIDGILIITTILLLSFALIAQATPGGAGKFGSALALFDATGATDNPSNDEE